ncbi:hypothetical protein FOL46_002137 [Perkinsus olseni]|uniref:Uncharacterized protein n=1 Tax=Perkinsus olseni TaxID=32597 RepID=A0A7J6MAW3_PEROL|nr:hypothetical protein FOL46_002137 [Perkinsus olseni]
MSRIRPTTQRHACGPAGRRSAPKAAQQKPREPATLARDERGITIVEGDEVIRNLLEEGFGPECRMGRCKLSNLRDSDKDRVARLVTTLAQQKKRAETEQRAREKAESSAERAVAEAERAKETLRRSLELLNRYHQRAKADLAERARLKACVAVSAPHPVKEVFAASGSCNQHQLGCSRHQRSLLRRYLQMSRDSETVAIKSREERESDKVLRDFLSKSVEERRPKFERPTAGSEASERAGPRPSTAAPRSEELENSAVLRSSISITASGDGKRVLRLQAPRSPRSSPRSPVGLTDAPKSPERCHRPRSPHASLSVTPKQTTTSPGLGHDAERHSLEVFLKLNGPAGDRLPEAPIPRPALWQQPRSPLGREQPAEVTAHLAEVDDVLSALSFTESHSMIHSSKIPLATERIRYGQIFR